MRIGLKKRVNEWRDRRSAAQEEQPADYRHRHDDGNKPIFFSCTHKSPKFFNKRHDVSCLKLLSHRFGELASRLSLNPIAFGFRIKLPPKRIFSKHLEEQCDRRE